MKRSARLSLLVAFLLLVMLSLALTACGGGDEPEGGVEPQTCEHAWVEKHRDTEFYCGKEGFVYYFCEKCFEDKTESLGIGDHPEYDLETREGYAPSCYSDGLTDGVFCNRCMSWKTPQETIPGGHTMEAIVAKAPTCTEDGVTAGSVCTKCDYADPRPTILYALHHDIQYTGGVDVTCTTDGMTPAEDCLREGCGYHKDPEVIEHPGHALEYEYGYAATCTTAGMTDEVWCTNWHLDCEYRIDAEEIPSLGHDIKSHTTTAATCREGGLVGGKYCDRCKIEMTPSFITLRTDCVFDATGACAVCGTHVTAGLTYTDYRDGVAVTGVVDFTGTKLVIPSTYNGKKVLAVAAGAFRNNPSVVEVILPSTVESVGADAFSGCTALTKVTVYDFADVKGFDSAWCDDDDVRIYAIYNNAKNPFETYVAARRRMQTNADRYRLSIHQTASEAMAAYGYSSTDTTVILREKAGDNWYEYYDFKTVDNQNLEGTSSVFEQLRKVKTWYYNGKLYQDDASTIRQNGETLEESSNKYMLSAGKEFMRSLVLSAGESLPLLDESYFEETEFYLSSDGVFTLRLVMDNDKMLEYVISVMGKSITDLMDQGAELEITVCTYAFKMDADGHLLSINADCEMTLGAAGTVVMTGGGHSSYVWTELGTLAAVTAPGTGYTDRTPASCTHYNTAKIPGVAPTCTEDGILDGIYCQSCLADVQAMAPVPATGHTDADGDGKCDTCEGWTNASNGLLYEFSEDGRTVTVLGIGTCTDKKLVIPAELYGMKVTAIAAGAFRGTGITEIVIPSTVTSIGADALPETIKRASLPAAVLSSLPKSVELVFVTSGDTIAAGSLVDLTNLYAIYIGQTVKTVEEGAASGCTRLYVVIYNYNSCLRYCTAGSDEHGGLLKYATIAMSGNENTLDEHYVLDGDFLFCDSYTGGRSTLVAYFGNASIVALPGTYNGRPVWIHKEAFRNNTAITKLVFPEDNVDILPYYDEIVANCPNLKTVEGPSSTIEDLHIYLTDTGFFAQLEHIIVTKAERLSTFWSNKSKNLKKITFTASVVSLGELGNTSVTEIEILGKDTTFTSDTFSDLRKLEKVTFPAGMSTLPQSLFYGLSSLKTVVLPTAITEIPYRFFRNCSSLASIEIPEGVTAIGDYAFYGCESLSTVSLPTTLRSIGSYVFYETDALASITLPTVPTGEELALGSCLFQKSGLTSIEIPEGVVTLPSSCFAGCASLTEISLPTTLRTIFNAFAGLTLPELRIPEGVTTIDYAFGDATIGRINLPASVTSMYYAFETVNTLVVNDGVTTIPSNAFTSDGSLRTLVLGKDLVTVSDSAILRAYELIDPTGANTVLESTFGYAVEAPHAGPDSRLYEYEGYLFYKKADGTSALLECLVDVPTALVLPTLPNGETYTVGARAFYSKSITSLVIPKCVTGIGAYAFAECADLAALYYDATIADADFGKHVFYRSGMNASSLVVTIGKNAGRIPNYFASDDSQTYYSLACTKVVFEAGSTCTEIGMRAFYNNPTIVELEIPSCVTSIATYAFGYLPRLATLTWDVVNGQSDSVASTIFDSMERNNYSEADTETGKHLDLTVVIGKNALTLPTYFVGEHNYRVTLIDFAEDGVLIEAPNMSAMSMENSRLKTLTLPASVRTIPEGAYDECDSLESVILNEGLTEIGAHAFNARYSLGSFTAITLPSTLEKIGDYAFYYSKITTIEFPVSLKEIGMYAFAYSELTAAHLPAGLTTLGKGAFESAKLTAVTLPTGAFAIPNDLFKNVATLRELVIPEGVTSMAAGALSGTSISKLTVPYIRIWGKDAYSNPVEYTQVSCLFNTSSTAYYSSLEEVTVTGNEIPNKAFAYLSGLKTVTFAGDNVTVGEYIFFTNSNPGITLSKLVFDCDTLTLHKDGYSFSKLASIGQLHVKSIELLCKTEFMWADYHPVDLAKKLYCGGEEIHDLVIPEGVTEIKPYAFYGAGFLTSVSIPGSCKTIGEHAFNNYSDNQITSITLAEGVETLGTGAFKYAKVTSLVLPASLKEIGDGALGNTALTSVTFMQPSGWYYGLLSDYSTAVSEDLSDPSAAAGLFGYSGRKICRPTVAE